jgi:hypothetical protein
MNELVLYLRELRSSAGLSMLRLHHLLAETIRSSDPLGDAPGLSTLHRRLGGENLHNQARMVDNIVEICAQTGGFDAEPARKRVRALRDRAREEMARDRAPAVPADAGQPSGPASRRAPVPLDAERRVAAMSVRLDEAVQENRRLTAEVSATRELISTLAAARPAASPEEAAVDSLRAQVDELAEIARQAAAEAQAARAEVATLLRATRAPVPPAAHVSRDVPAHREEAAAPRLRIGTAGLGQIDPELVRLVEILRRHDPDGSGMASVIEGAGAYLLDGERTGRYTWDQLLKNEKMMFGTIVSRLAQKNLGLEDGERTQFSVGGIEFDLRYALSQHWTISPELIGELVVLVHADEDTGRYGCGVVRVQEDLLSTGANRDDKRTLRGRDVIQWIHRDAPFETSILQRLEIDDREAVLHSPSATVRLSELFRRAEGIPVSRTDVVTVARQPDALRRVRDARDRLAAEGVLLAGHPWPHGSVLDVLGVPTPASGKFVSIRLAPARAGDEGPTVSFDGTRWRRARPEDPQSALPTGFR